MKATQFLLRSPGRLVLSLLLGLLTAWLLRGEVTMLLLGKDFTGRSLPVQAALLGMTALTVALIYTVILHLYGDTMRACLKGTPDWLQTHPEITLILFFSLVVSLLADWNSYWYDELVSVKLLGIDRSSGLDVVNTLNNGDRHPPLYHLVFYYWMGLLGSSEIATHMLSTLYVTLASLFLYLFAHRLYGKRTSTAAVLFFTLSNIAVAYSLESNEYAQTLFLRCLSSWFLLRYLENLEGNVPWLTMLVNQQYFLLLLANTALLLTHYYNAYFVLAQSIFVFFAFLSKARWKKFLPVLLKVTGIYTFQLMVFIVLWGYPLLEILVTYGGGLNKVSNPTGSPLNLLTEYVVLPNFKQPGAVWIILFLSLLAMPGIRLPEAGLNHQAKRGEAALFWGYLVCWGMLTLIIVFLSFSFFTPPIFNARYFIYCTPPLMLLVVLGLEQVVAWMDRFTQNYFNKSAWGHYARNALLYALLAAAILVLPRGYDAAVTRKHDWRGTAWQLVNLVQSDPGKNYAIIETSHRDTPLIDFYLQLFSPSLRAAGVLKASEEDALAAGEISQPAFLQSPALAQSDYLVVTYIHFRQSAFPLASALLEAAYPVRLRVLNNEGRGYVVYVLRTAGE